MAEIVVIRDEATFRKYLQSHPYFNVSRPKLIHPGSISEKIKNWAVCPKEDLIWWLFKYETDQMDFFREYHDRIVWRGVWRE